MHINNFYKLKNKLKVLFVGSEAAPFIKVGGLGEVMRSLPKALRSIGIDARIMVPKYATMDSNFKLTLELEKLKPVPDSQDPNGLFVSNVLSYEEKGRVIAYFLENLEYYEKRANTYGYADDAVRWALLSKGVIEFLKKSLWTPDVIVACDWQAGLISNYLHAEYKDDSKLSNIAVLFSIHNLSYQGMFDHRLVVDMDYDSGREKIAAFDDPRLLKLNFMRRGIMYADAINTVSPTYAQEITTPEHGEFLNELLSERRMSLFGILNGIDYEMYNPENDPHLKAPYSIKTFSRRNINKIDLCKKFNLSKEDIPLFCVISRLTDQKGFGLFFNTLRPLLTNFNFKLIVLGSGDKHYVDFFANFAREYPERVAGHFMFDEALPHMILGAADGIVIPSRFEPSGLTQLEAMRYGVVPIVRKTGGLADTVVDYNPKEKKGTGFVFENFDDFAFYGAMARALEIWRHQNFWEDIQKRAMKTDFSWDRSAREYVELFEKILVTHKNKKETL